MDTKKQSSHIQIKVSRDGSNLRKDTNNNRAGIPVSIARKVEGNQVVRKS